jgi:hypothetical protein
MNERILELAKDHLLHDKYGSDGQVIEGDYYEFDPQELQDFVQSIVKECIVQIQLSTARDPQHTAQYKQSVGHIHKIRQHFGIE